MAQQQAAASYPSFLEHLRSRYGTNWCVGRRSGKTARYDTVIAPSRYANEQREWAEKHPAFLLANSLPDCPEKQIILRAVLNELA